MEISVNNGVHLCVALLNVKSRYLQAYYTDDQPLAADHLEAANIIIDDMFDKGFIQEFELDKYFEDLREYLEDTSCPASTFCLIDNLFDNVKERM